MKKKIKLVSAILILSVASIFQVSAYSILYRFFNYGNVSVTSPVMGERYIHAKMAGKYAEMLAKELGYSQKISIKFDYYHPEYIADRKFRLKYAEEEWRFSKKGKSLKRPIKRSILEIVQNNEKVDITDVLKLLEYAILNRDKVVANQENVSFKRDYHDPFETQTLSEAMIDSILQQPVSAMVSKVLSNRIYRKETEEIEELTQISYYAQDGKFYVYKEPLTVQEFDHIWQFSPVRYSEFRGTCAAILFDTPNTFRYINAYWSNPAYVSPSHSIGDDSVAEHPCIVRELSSKLVSIVKKAPMIAGLDRTMIYIVPRDSLVMNLEKLLGEQEDKRLRPGWVILRENQISH